VASWAQAALAGFVPGMARLIIATDPDGVLLEPGLLQELKERGFDLHSLDDPVAFRAAYEEGYRSRWDAGDQDVPALIVRVEAQDLATAPYDVAQAAHLVSLSLGILFPTLSYPVVTALEKHDLALLAAVASGPLGPASLLDERATKEYVLIHLFGIVPDLIGDAADLLRALLSHHYRGRRLPPTVREYLVERLQQRCPWVADWPLQSIVGDRDAFIAFLQERWPRFIDYLVAERQGSLHEIPPPYALAYAGPADLPFAHNDVRAYIDNLFADGLLKPIAHPAAHLFSQNWVRIGLRTDPVEHRDRRMQGLLDLLDRPLPALDAPHTEWITLAQRWAELKALRFGQAAPLPSHIKARIKPLDTAVDAAFLEWMTARYSSLHSQPPLVPAMVHHVTRALARYHEEMPQQKLALVVLDGLALDQWILLRTILNGQRPEWRFRESAVFAWVPTITPVSRQAIFAGKPPGSFAASVTSTEKEAALWTAFWAANGLAAHQVAYHKGLGDLPDLRALGDYLSSDKVRVVGLVVDKVDLIMHGMQLGTVGMHDQVRLWAGQGFPMRLLDLLNDRGFTVFLTADHGNVQATGWGRPNEGAIADLRGARARVYPEGALRDQVYQAFPTAIAWQPIGLPPHYFPLLAPRHKAFVIAGEGIVGHGGLSIEEVIVPYVRIEWKTVRS